MKLRTRRLGETVCAAISRITPRMIVLPFLATVAVATVIALTVPAHHGKGLGTWAIVAVALGGAAVSAFAIEVVSRERYQERYHVKPVRVTARVSVKDVVAVGGAWANVTQVGAGVGEDERRFRVVPAALPDPLVSRWLALASSLTLFASIAVTTAPAAGMQWAHTPPVNEAVASRATTASGPTVLLFEGSEQLAGTGHQ